MSSNLHESPFKCYHLPAPPILANEMFILLIDYMLMTDFDRPQFEAEDELRQFVAEEHPFYDYATVHWEEYIQYVDISRPATLQALLRLIQMPKATQWLTHQISSSHATGTFRKPDGQPHPLRGPVQNPRRL